MNIERRNLIRLGSAGLAGSIFASQWAFGSDATKDSATGALGRNSGSLVLDLRFDQTSRTPGALKLQIDDFILEKCDGADICGTFAANGVQTKLSRSYLCVDNGKQVFARLGDNDHWTNVLVASTQDPNIESLIVWHDERSPESFLINHRKFRDGLSQEEYVLDNKGVSLDLEGARRPVDISAEDFENALANNADYLASRRGKKLTHNHAAMRHFACTYITAAVPGGAVFSPVWNAGH